LIVRLSFHKRKNIFYYHTSEGYEVDFITQDLQGKYELIQVVWDINDPLTLESEKRTLTKAEEELGFPGKIVDHKDYLRGLTIS
jgi:predicted AAA+ superfamily ATPase